MDTYLKNYKLKVKTLSPVFIGSGQQINKLEYILDGKRLYVVDMRTLMRDVVERGLTESFYRFMHAKQQYLKSWLDSNGMRDYKKYAAYELNGTENIDRSRSLKGIAAFIKNAYNEPYVPGSSIKGMLRTIILWNKVYDNYDKHGKDRAQIKRTVREAESRRIKSELKRCSDSLEREYFTEKKDKDTEIKLMRGLIVGDSNPLTLDDIVLCKKIDVHPDGKEKEPNIFRECLRPGVEFECELTIDANIFPYSADELEKMITDYAKDYAYVVTDYFPECYRSAEDDKAVVLGGGAGYFSKTVTYSLFENDEAVDVVSGYMSKTTPRVHNHGKDRKIGISPHTQKCTEFRGNIYEMGKCSVEII